MYTSMLTRAGGWGAERFAPERSSAPIDWCQMRRTIVAVARRENARWTTPSGTKLLESNPSQLPILTQYWSAVPGFSDPRDARRAARLSAADHLDGPWSAAFICFVMRTAGLRPSDGFAFGQKHITYIAGALRNRERSDRTRPFWLVDHVELQHEAPPQPGDLLCFNRPNARGVMSTHSYSSLRRQFWSGGHQSVTATGISHCRIVLGPRIVRGQTFIETIGGNETNSVRRQRILVDQFGNIPNPGALNIFGMIRLIKCVPRT